MYKTLEDELELIELSKLLRSVEGYDFEALERETDYQDEKE